MIRQVLHGTVVIIIVVYVNGLLIASITKHDEEFAPKEVYSCFLIKDLGKLAHYLGFDITRDRGAGTLKVDQHQYVKGEAKRSGITKIDTIPSAARGKTLSKADEMRKVPYQEVIRSFIGAVIMTCEIQ